MSKMIKVAAEEDHSLVIELDNHHKIIYDMKSRLLAVRFCELSDICRFKAVKIENGNTLVWESLCQLTLDEIISHLER